MLSVRASVRPPCACFDASMLTPPGRIHDGHGSRGGVRPCDDRRYVIRPTGVIRTDRYPWGVDIAPPETRHLTFLFADVEGSTRLMERHGADAGAALSRYHELVALAASRHGGKLFERIGDGAYACFTDAGEAVAAADAVQRAIVEHDWGVIGRMRVRISIVTGDVEARDDRYYGRPLFRAARLQALANG